MKKTNPQKQPELSYFYASLHNFLTTYHPQLAGDGNFIHSRCEEAETTFYTLIHNGENMDIAHSAAMQQLKEGLHFSLYTCICDRLEEYFIPEIPPDRITQTALSLLPECQKLYDIYPFDDPDNPEESPLYETFLLELTNKIKHELQQKTTLT